MPRQLQSVDVLRCDSHLTQTAVLSVARCRCVVCCARRSSATRAAEYLIGYMGVGGNGCGQSPTCSASSDPTAPRERYPDFGRPNQKSWVFGPMFSDGQRMILTSFENTDVKSVRSGKVVTHDWIYDLQSGDLQPTLEHDRQADQLRPYALAARRRACD